MRIDKYLKKSRLIKRRTIAKEVVENGRIILNGRPEKPSREVKIGDIIILNLGRHRLEVKIENIDEIATRQKSSTFYTLLKDEIIERTED